MRRDARTDAYQPGLPGVLPEEAPLPSEVVLDGGVLDRRRREALAAIRGALLDRPAEFDADEWRVVVSSLAPPSGHLGRTPGTSPGRYGILQLARDCFPALSAPQAFRRYRECQGRPHVRAFLADMRALEMADVLEQRGPVRERLWCLVRLADAVDPRTAVDPEGGAGHIKAAMVACAAAKLLIEMDGLRASAAPDDPDADGDGTGGEAEASAVETARAKVERVAADLQKRALAKAPA